MDAGRVPPDAIALAAMVWTLTSEASRTRDDVISHLATHTKDELRAELVERLERRRGSRKT